MDILVTDATAAGKPTSSLTLSGVPEPVTLADLIRFRVREEVARYNAMPTPVFQGLVKPTDAEATLNGYRLSKPRRLDWEKQADAALAAFRGNDFFVFVGDRQVTDLDEELTLRETNAVSFVRLVSLVGG